MYFEFKSTCTFVVEEENEEDARSFLRKHLADTCVDYTHPDLTWSGE